MQSWNLSLEDRIDKHSLFKVFELNTTSLLEKKSVCWILPLILIILQPLWQQSHFRDVNWHAGILK